MSTVVVAMSGGVDSSVTAGLMVEQGHTVIGVHMKLHDVPAPAPGKRNKTCCGLDEALDARAVADTLGIPFHVLDLRQAFRKAVMDDLADTYLSGATPNPCIRCNGVLKFQVLLRRALALGADKLATGHYARVIDGPTGPALARAADLAKDQSYFLFPLSHSVLGQTLFPLGGMDKDTVRGHAERMDLVTADKPESQEICFIPDQDHARFVSEHRPDHAGDGEIVDEHGRVLGLHDGYWRFTVGQRRGLRVAASRRLYVQSVDPKTGRVVVSGATGLWHGGLDATGWTWNERPEPGRVVDARIRHNGHMIPCVVDAGDPVRVRFLKPAWAVAPGQAVVLYDGDRVLGGGWIQRSHPFDGDVPTAASTERRVQ
jgi:tRNA-specific 2-thiouridylase